MPKKKNRIESESEEDAAQVLDDDSGSEDDGLTDQPLKASGAAAGGANLPDGEDFLVAGLGELPEVVSSESRAWSCG